MKVNSNNVFAKLHRYLYNTKEMPTSPYTYGFNVLIALILILPVTIFCIPAYLVEIVWYLCDHKMKWSTCAKERIYITLSFTGIILFFTAIILSIMNPFTSLTNVFWDLLRLVGDVINCIFIIGIIGAIFHGLKWVKNKIVNKTPKLEWDK